MASAPGLSSQAVVRLSGPQALRAVARLLDSGGDTLLEEKGFRGRAIALRLDHARLRAWANFYRAPRSYTREDVVELFVHGSPPILNLLSTALLAARSDGDALVRWAHPGEFTLRAFLSGRIDLSQAESVAALIGATGEAEARAARRGLRGELRDRFDALVDALTEIIALLEAALDFPDEDLPQISPEAISERFDAVARRLQTLRAACGRLSGADGTLRVVLAGFPNAGKSTLLNAILRREAAIATAVPGTTRDPVRGVTVHRGRRVEWVDLAGTYSARSLTSEDESRSSEPEGARRPGPGGPRGMVGDQVIWRIVRRLSKVEFEAADLVLWVLDPTADVEASLAEVRRMSGKSVLLVVQKSDRLRDRDGAGRKGELSAAVSDRLHFVSAVDGEGVSELVGSVLATAERRVEGAGSPPRFLVSAHQQAALEAAGDALARAREAIVDPGYEFAAADLRDAVRALEDLTGRVTSDAILEQVFSRFCIGK